MTTPLLDPGSRTPLTERATQPAAPSDSPLDPRASHGDWSPLHRVAFRFAFVYLVIYNLPFPLSLPPFGGPIATIYNKLWYAVIPWIGTHVLQLSTPITAFPAGSSDTRFSYVQLLVFAVIAAMATIIWSARSRNARDHRRLHHWLRIYIRYALAVTLLVYGAAKVIKMQFPTPALGTLLEPFGDLSPTGALWGWMGISSAYNLFAGLMEMVPGVLLLFRRTATLGALLGAGALANVVVMNFAYDVPVKLSSSHLLLMACFLLVPDLKRLVDVFVLNRSVPAADLGPYPTTPRLRVARYVVKTMAVCVAIGIPLVMAWILSKRVGGGAVKPPLYGIYEVDSFVLGRDTLPPLVTDTVRWRRLLVSYPGGMSVRLMNDSTRYFVAKVDTAAKRLTLSSPADTAKKFPLTYAVAGDRLSIDGPFAGDTLHVRLRRIDHTKFRLLSPGFHWVTEYSSERW